MPCKWPYVTLIPGLGNLFCISYVLRVLQGAIEKATKEKMKGNNIYKVLIYTSPVLDVLYTLTLILLRAL